MKCALKSIILLLIIPFFLYVPTAADDMETTLTNSIGQTFQLIPSGTFTMGCPSSELGRTEFERSHRVTISKSFYMQTTEVTVDQWKSVMGDNPSEMSECGRGDCPVEMVSWEDAQEFIRRLNAKEGTDLYRLPTEAEWEYAARAGSTKAFSNGEITELECWPDPNLVQMAWYCSNSHYSTHPVGQKQPNQWGLFDMHGNVRELCQDWFGEQPADTVKDPVGPVSGPGHVIKGGCWHSYAWTCRSSYRYWSEPGERDLFTGVRLVRAK